MRTILWLLLPALVLPGCENDGPGPSGFPDAAVGEGLFVEGCPVPGRSTARVIGSPDARLTGPHALAGEGDVLLMNEHSAFVIQAPDRVKTYYEYGGLPIDAVALRGCAPAGPERFKEFGLLLTRVQVADYLQSIMRAFRGDQVEVVNDGADGQEAVVRVTGTDDRYWLIELELMRSSLLEGTPKPLSDPYQVALAMEYRLAPDRPVLEMELQLRNLGEDGIDFQVAAILLFGDEMPVDYFAGSSQSVSGFSIEFDTPWLVSSQGDGAWAFARPGANLATANIHGMGSLLDFQELLEPLYLAPAGHRNDTASTTFLLAVGPTDGNSAVRHLQPLNPTPVPDRAMATRPLSGRVTDAVSGAPVAGARVAVQLLAGTRGWQALDVMTTDADGRYAGELTTFDNPDLDHRLAVTAPGRPDAAPVTFRPASTSTIDVALAPGGVLQHDVRDQDARGIPAKIQLWQEGRVAHRIHTTAQPGEVALPPGTYDVSVTRGYEYTTHQGTLEITASGTTPLSVTLDHQVDTTGWLSFDGHAHASDSPDSAVPVWRRIQSAAAEGLHVIVSTDHESVADWSPGIAEAGLVGWIATVVGQEVTASMPEHTNMYPVVPDPDGVRGGRIAWMGLGLAEIFAAERARGAGVIGLNHPRNGCSLLCLIGYDRLTGVPTLDDPTVMGLDPSMSIWAWDFDTVELMNGNTGIFMYPDNPEGSGIFEDWMSFLNLGHRKTAVAVTDVHAVNAPGDPRTYFEATTTDLATFDETDLVDAMKGGRAVISTGAFARVEINDVAGPGDDVTDTDGAVDLAVHVEASTEIDVAWIKVFVNCDEVLTVATDDPTGVVKHDEVLSIPVTEDAHVVVMGFGAGRLPRGLDQFDPARIPRFVTNAIYVDADGNGTWDPPGGKACSYTLDPP